MRPLPPVLFACLLATGCGGGSSDTVTIPSYDPGAMADAAIKQFDKNNNGTIEGAELDACPALKVSLAAIDTDKNQALSKDELVERFKAYKAAGAGAIAFGCVVKVGGQPLSEAEVTFTPEECMKGAVKGGSGQTLNDGSVRVSAEGSSVVGLPPGLYKISVSKKNAGGGEILPARYNANTVLGREIFYGSRSGPPTIELNLQ